MRLNNTCLLATAVASVASVAGFTVPASAAPFVAEFRQGVDGYASSSVAAISSDNVTLLNGATFNLSNNTSRRALLRFDDIVGAGPGQIPLDADIVSATLTMTRQGGGAAGAQSGVSLFRNLTAYDPATVTYSSYSAPSANPVAGTSYVTPADDSFDETVAGTTYEFDVTASLQAWTDDPTTNVGWFFTNITGAAFNTWHGVGATGDNEVLRPTLTVTYVPEPASLSLLGLGGLSVLRRRRV